MLKFFFNRESKIIYVMEVLGLIFLALLIVRWWPSGKSTPEKLAFLLYILIYIVIRAFASLNWYDNKGRNRWFPPRLKGKVAADPELKYPGVELQFKKAMIPTSYILAIFSFLLLIGFPGWLLYIADALLIIIVHVNFILLYFHVKDKETLPVNYFTHNKHLRAEK